MGLSDKIQDVWLILSLKNGYLVLSFAKSGDPTQGWAVTVDRM